MLMMLQIDRCIRISEQGKRKDGDWSVVQGEFPTVF